MKHQTFDRFQGIWLGGIFGQALANHIDSGSSTGIIDFPPQNWLVERRQVAEMLLSSPRSAAIELSTGGDKILSLLSLIIFDEANQGNSNLAETTEIRDDIIIWSYLLTSVLNHKFDQRSLSHLNNQEGTGLTQKLKLVVQAVNSGISLDHLLDSLSSDGNIQDVAISLSWYCFVTSPQDFKISVQRAASIPNIGGLTAALTSTLSGAYNGMTGIPYNWRSRMSQNLNYSLENQLVRKLFKAWLGIYAIDHHQESYNQELDAVASLRVIQPRQDLKIISQKSRFSGI